MKKLFLIPLLFLVGCLPNSPTDVLYDCSGSSVETKRIMAETIKVCWENGNLNCLAASKKAYCMPVLRKNIDSKVTNQVEDNDDQEPMDLTIPSE